MKTLTVFVVLVSISFAQAQNQLTLCLRTKDVDFEQFKAKASNCSLELSQLKPYLEDSYLEEALNKATSKIEAQPSSRQKVWASFLKQLKTKIWSERHSLVAHEIQLKLGILENTAEKTSLSVPSPMKGWEDLQIYRNGVSYSETHLSDPSENHWMAYSSLYAPLIFWGTEVDFRRLISREAGQPWLSQHCQAAGIPISVPIIPMGCRDLFKAVPEKENLLSTEKRGFNLKEPVFLGVIGVTLLGVLAYSLKDKKLVIRK